MSTKSDSSQDNRVLFVGYLFPDWLESKILEQEISPIQTQRFGLALLDALILGFDNRVEVFSVAPLLDYPHSHLIIAPSAKWKIDDKIAVTMLPFINLVGIKHFTRFIVTLAFVAWWCLRHAKTKRIIVMHGVQSCKIWGVLIGQVLSPCITISFLTDDLGIMQNWENNIFNKLRQFDIYLMKLGLQKVTGVLAMAPKLAEKLAPDRPSLVVHTIQSPSQTQVANKIKNTNKGSFNILYTGGLSINYGIDLLLNTFRLANRPEWRLFITGWGDSVNKVRDFSVNNPQVQFLGTVDNKKLAELYQLADVLINPKLTSTSGAWLSFPSKIVEYLSTGKPVVSTNLPVFDADFRQHLIIAQSDTPEELIRCLEDVSSWNDQQRESWRAQTIKFVQEELSPVAQGTRIRGFVDSLEYKKLTG